MSEYKTEQKKLLLDFLKKNKDKSFTVEEIERGICDGGGFSPGKSTIYRLVSKLAENGEINRFASERGMVCQYKGDMACGKHLHMRCTECGRILHMKDSTSEELLNEIFSKSNFSVDKERTILFGICSACEK